MILALRPDAPGLYRLAELLDDGTEHGDYRAGLALYAKYAYDGFTYWMFSTSSKWIWFRTRADGHVSGAVPEQSRDGSTFPPKEWLDRAHERGARIEWRADSLAASAAVDRSGPCSPHAADRPLRSAAGGGR